MKSVPGAGGGVGAAFLGGGGGGGGLAPGVFAADPAQWGQPAISMLV
jgi:hypothetical protein